MVITWLVARKVCRDFFQIVPYFVKDVLSYPSIPGMFVACVFCGSLRYHHLIYYKILYSTLCIAHDFCLFTLLHKTCDVINAIHVGARRKYLPTAFDAHVRVKYPPNSRLESFQKISIELCGSVSAISEA